MSVHSRMSSAALAALGGVAVAMPRAVALFLGGFMAINVVADLVVGGYDLNVWSVDTRFLGERASFLLATPSSITLIAFGVRPDAPVWRRRSTLLVIGALALIAITDTIRFYILVASGQLGSVFPLPFSLFLLTGVVIIGRSVVKIEGTGVATTPLALTSTMLLVALLFGFLQIICFGTSDYRRQADVAVVFGARAFADGRLSRPLADRMRTACDLYRAGYIRAIIVTGGPGDGVVHETEAMRRMAVRFGVPDDAILTDTMGLNTRASVTNSDSIAHRIGARRMIAVSSFYHLPRIKMAYQRIGRVVYTVPADDNYLFSTTPLQIAREVLGIWAYYGESMLTDRRAS